jgi:AraC-like DNA-binding protein
MNESATPTFRPPRRPFARIKRVAYRNPTREGLGIVVVDTAFAREDMSLRHFLGPQRLDFYQLLLFTSGSGFHTVDLVRYPVSPGVLIIVRPGQIQEWDSVDWPSAKMLLFHPSFLLPDIPEYPATMLLSLADPWPVHFLLTTPELIMFEDSIDEIREEIEHSDDSLLLSTCLLSHLLYALLIRLRRMMELALPGEAEGGGAAQICRAFRLEVERHFKTSRSVGDFAAALGYCQKSLCRATMSSAGVTPKHIIDERISLEAQRLLVHTRWSVKRIAVELGFDESMDFVRFFRRTTGQTPTQCRYQGLSLSRRRRYP